MLKISFIKKNKDKLIKSLKLRKFKNINLIYDILYLYKKNNFIKKKIDKLSKKINNYSKLYIYNKNNKKFYKKILIIKKYKKKINNKYKFIKKKLLNKIVLIPNILNDFYLNKKNKNKIIIYKYGNYKKINPNKFLSHIELANKFELFDTKLASSISGSGFVIYSGLGLKLYNALVKYFIYYNNIKGYKEYELPYLVSKDSLYGTGQYPQKKNQIYNINKDKLYLIPTGEVPLINIYKNKIFNIRDLPIKAQTYTNCFRREAGSYGKKVKGLNRIHQFGKVEIIEISDKKSSNIRLNKMLNHIKNLLKSLKLTFRILLLPSHDLSFTSSITYDFEVYSVGQKMWLEVSSLSNCLDYQSNNLNIKYKNNNKIRNCHTLNGSSLSIPRILASIIELYQKETKIEIPSILLPFYK
ncbi:MAG: serine--tRNA ligase [Candidatus Shikimatogenerans bostrichidophilus]|nr:MAG: serine--tRNA ligase [Candidatus Shikimatogenerans bostrichidophilus]